MFSVLTDDKEKIVLFEAITEYVASKRDNFAKAIINKLVNFNDVLVQILGFQGQVYPGPAIHTCTDP